LGTLLTSVAEREANVFIVATANDVSQLPPELLHKGRMDEIFFGHLPEPLVPEQIFAIHLEKRNFTAANFELALLAQHSPGFSGAQIEQAVVAGLYSVSAAREPLATEHVVAQLRPPTRFGGDGRADRRAVQLGQGAHGHCLKSPRGAKFGRIWRAIKIPCSARGHRQSSIGAV
jgi:hypothetical protein